ncbi:TonB family protein [Xanthobacter sediminis]|uniref:TonB family protein n=1 Tax=Xanthobacter sediminis TaxID=3119926 RepID=UPI00372C4572
MTFTLAHGFALSLALHGAVLLPFTLTLEQESPPQPELLVLELHGIVADTQNEQQVQQQARGSESQHARDAAEPQPAPEAMQPPAPEQPETPATPDGTQAAPLPSAAAPEQVMQQSAPTESATPATERAGDAGAANIVGSAEVRQAQSLAIEQNQAERLRRYVQALTKKVQESLVYPAAGRHEGLKGTARVAFALGTDGTLQAGSLRIAESSGQSLLDENALKTVAASAPFGTPPRPISVTIAVTYGRRK